MMDACLKQKYLDQNKLFDNKRLKIIAQKKWKEKHSDCDNFKASNKWCNDFKKNGDF